MKNKPFVEAFHDINSRLIGLVETLSALRELSGFEVAAGDESELLENSLEIVVQNLGLEYVFIHMPEPQDKLKIAASVGWEMVLDQEEHQHLPRIEEYVFNLVQAVSGDVAKSLIYNEDDCSFISLPILANNELLGVFTACHGQKDYFTVEHERSLIIYCNFLGQLIVNNRLLFNMEQLVQERTGQLQQALNEAEVLKERYETLSVVDELTELHNRRFFFPEAQAAVARASRYNEQFSVLVLDIDHFKSINDRFGHAMGDEVLKTIARLLRDEAREADIIARFGGEEFVLALPETDETGAVTLGERIRKRIEQLKFEHENNHFNLTISAGIAALEKGNRKDSSELLEELLQRADTAMYHSKDNGRNQLNCYSAIACGV